jgi:hypothetical protein
MTDLNLESPAPTGFKIGDRVFVTDPGLAQLRDIMARATGTAPKPNHYGTIADEQYDDINDDSLIINFDDGTAAPYPLAEIRHLKGE